MKSLATLAAALLLAAAATTANASTIGPGGSAQGITYDFSLLGGALNSTSATFGIHITGINNAVTDLEGGRSGINAFALSTPGLPNIASGSTTLAGAPFQSGGLNSGGCNGSGGFFCFGNTGAANSPALAANSVIDIAFTLNLVSGNFLGWTPAFKIDWAGSANNYDLVSQAIPGGAVGINPQISPVPLPAVGTGLPGILAVFMLGLRWLRRRREGFHLPEARAALA